MKDPLDSSTGSMTETKNGRRTVFKIDTFLGVSRAPLQYEPFKVIVIVCEAYRFCRGGHVVRVADRKACQRVMHWQTLRKKFGLAGTSCALRTWSTWAAGVTTA